jgi:tetratricopeptide (TPR) repeat protein
VQYLRLNQLDNADEALAAALKIDPAAFEPLINRGITIFRLKRYADAEPLLRQAVEKKSDSSIAHYYLGRTLTSLERYDDAEKELNSAVTLGGNEMKEAHRMLATMFIAKGDNKKAVNALEIYLGLVPTASDAAYLRDVIAQLKASDLSPKPL